MAASIASEDGIVPEAFFPGLTYLTSSPPRRSFFVVGQVNVVDPFPREF
jgi:hypothetical protein